MKDIDDAIDAVRTGPEGPSVGAFFDLDGTLVKGFTALAFMREELVRIGPPRLLKLIQDVVALRNDPERDLKAIERAAELLGGRTVDELETFARKVFVKRIASTIRPGARELVRAHLKKGHTVVMATAATRFQAAPVAQDLEIPHLISTEVEVIDGRLTGRLEGRPRWGVEKAKGVVHFALSHDVDLTHSWGYGNGGEDQDFLQAVGRPIATNPDRRLVAYAHQEGIPVLRLPDPPVADLRGVIGTLGAFGAFNAGILASIAAKLLSGGRWRAINPTAAVAAEICLWLAGVEVRAQGHEHLEATRPAIFVVNHQSNLDPPIVATLVRHDFTGVGKQEVGSDPRSWALRFLDVALIDRSDSASAQASVNALVQRIHDGESVVIFPEGTRSPTPRLGPFKKGAFHLALDAQVPLVPIVVRNTAQLWPRGKSVIRPGIAEVCVLPPVSTTGWTRDRLDQHVAEVRGLFERTLEDWPTAG